MKVLIVSWYFPPCSTMGALRVGKFAKYLVGQGHDVRIVCAKDQPFAMDHPVEVPEEIIFYSPWRDVNWLPVQVQKIRVGLKKLKGGSQSKEAGQKNNGPKTGTSVPAADGKSSGGLLRFLLVLYRHFTNIPDAIIGWLLPALKAGRQATRNWKPDVVFASAPPFTTLIAGRIIAKRCGAPLVLEYRDRWIEDPYFYMPPARLWVDRKIENWCAAPARHIVTVSDPWAEDYVVRWGKPVTVCYNGFDPDDVVLLDDIQPNTSSKVSILYTGILYPDRRDPTPLFEALSGIENVDRKFEVNFYGASENELRPMIERFGLQETVKVHERITFKEVLALQRKADLLLLLQWNNPLEAGNVPGKLFEYMAARRPVLGIGYEGGVPARILQERGAGQVTNDPGEIRRILDDLVSQKSKAGVIPLLPDDVAEGLSRPEQYAQIENALQAAIGPNR